MPRYQYVPLDLNKWSIRLVRVLPARNRKEPIYCEIFRCTLRADASEVYEALSWVWGDPEVTEEIFVIDAHNASAPAYTLPVTTNLCAALREIREVPGMGLLWVDAICIDQANLRERGHQVQRMLDIYQLAQRVRIWLGPEIEGTGGSLDKIVHKLSTGLYTSKASVKKFTPYLRRPWFRRIWIIQEVAAGKRFTIMCGSSILSGRYFAAAFDRALISGKATTVFNAVKHVVELMKRPRGNTRANLVNQQPLSVLVRRFFDKQATDPRDKVYALIGISKNTQYTDPICPDYALPVDQVFQKLVNLNFTGFMEGAYNREDNCIVLSGMGFCLGNLSRGCGDSKTRIIFGVGRKKWFFCNSLRLSEPISFYSIWLFNGTYVPFLVAKHGQPEEQKWSKSSLVQTLEHNLPNSMENPEFNNTGGRWKRFVDGLKGGFTQEVSWPGEAQIDWYPGS